MKFFTSALFIILLGIGAFAQNSNLKPATLPGNDSQLNVPSSTNIINANLEETDKGVTSTIDQDQPLDNSYMASFNQGGIAQSFIPSANDICGAGVAVFNPGGTDITADITIAVWDNLPNAGGNQLATGTITGTFNGTPVFADVSWATIAISPGTTYYLVFSANNGTLGIRGHLNNPYPFGNVFANNYDPFPAYDYTFHTFFCGTPTVPIGNWAIVLSILLIGTFVIIRYRNKLA